MCSCTATKPSSSLGTGPRTVLTRDMSVLLHGEQVARVGDEDAPHVVLAHAFGTEGGDEGGEHVAVCRVGARVPEGGSGCAARQQDPRGMTGIDEFEDERRPLLVGDVAVTL